MIFPISSRTFWSCPVAYWSAASGCTTLILPEIPGELKPQELKAANKRESLDSVLEAVEAAYEVSNVLGAGFLEKVYERALLRELAVRGLRARSQVVCPVNYKGQCVGEYVADLTVEAVVGRAEVRRRNSPAKTLPMHQLPESIRLTLALLIKFQKPKVEWKRIGYSRPFAA